MVNLVDVELRNVKTEDGRTVPGACGTCRRCGRTATVERWLEQGTRPIAAGHEKLKSLIKRACDAVSVGCPRTSGPDREQSFPHTYFVAIIPPSVHLSVSIRGRLVEAQLYDKVVATIAGEVDRNSDIWVEYDCDNQEDAIRAVNHLSKLGYNANRILSENLQKQSHPPHCDTASSGTGAASRTSGTVTV